MEKIFKIRASQAHKIMGRIGLTDKQNERISYLKSKEKLTAIQENELSDLILKQSNIELPTTCTSYLKEWYANDEEDLFNKYINKGINVEDELIDFMADVLGFGMSEKNKIRVSDEYFEGTCDVELPNCIVDVKASWNKRTLHENIYGINEAYKVQLIIYCHLYKKEKGILFYGLMNTPETDWEQEIVYDHIPNNERWIAYDVAANPEYIDEIIERVKLCRIWIENYDKELKSKLGKIN